MGAAGIADLKLRRPLSIQMVERFEPSPLILRLFLAPDQIGEVGVAIHLGAVKRLGKWIKLFDADDGDMCQLCLLYTSRCV